MNFPETNEDNHLQLENGWTVSIQPPKFVMGENMIHADEDTREIWAFNNGSTYPEEPIPLASPEKVHELIDHVKTL